MKKLVCLLFLAFLSYQFVYSEDELFSGLNTENTVVESNVGAESVSTEDTNTQESSSNNKSPKFYQNNLRGQAVIVRASKLAIPPTGQLIANNLKDSFSGIPSTQETLSNFNKKYLLDSEATESSLKAMGYTIKNVFSSEYKTGTAYKNALKAAVQDENTTLLIFYGHGDKGNGVALYYPSEYAFSDPSHLTQIQNPNGNSTAGLSSNDLKNWLGDRKLDSLILMSCNGAYQTYLEKHEVPGKKASSSHRWDEVVKKGGFFAGWATYSLYFNPKTPKILASMKRHQDSESKTTKYYYIMTGPLLKKISVIAGLDDGETYWTHLSKDNLVRVHDEDVDGFVTNMLDLAQNIQDSKSTVFSSVKSFLINHQKFLKEEGIKNTNSDGSYGELPQNPSVSDLNSYINASSSSVAKMAFAALAPGLIVPEKVEVFLSESNPDQVKIRAHIKVKRGDSLKKVLSIVGDNVKGISGVDQKALKENIKTLHGNFPELEVKLNATMTRSLKNGKLSVEPAVHGYQIFLGGLQNRRPAKKTDFEVHADIKDINKFVKQAVEKQFGAEQKVFAKSWTIDYLINTYTIGVKGFIKLYNYKGLNIYWRSKDTLDISAKWRFKIDWPWIGTRYAYATTKIFLKRSMLTEPNAIRVTPEIQLQLGNGWAPQVPNVKWLPTGIVNKFFNKASKWVIGTGISKTFGFLEKEINKMIHSEIGNIIPKDPDGQRKFDAMLKKYPHISKTLPKSSIDKLRKDANKQKINVKSVDSSGDTITAKFSGVVLNMAELIPGLDKENMLKSILLKDVVSSKRVLSGYADLR
ncbi:MAG: hypothetical protein KC646_17505 [Candidatus Cloacimonetes bacterium]|nr:hypothetical protein [Candidatus Cloacimonadota bacterium]